MSEAAVVVKGNIIDILKKQIYFSELKIKSGKVESIQKIKQEQQEECYILPGFVDSHVHIESSMLIPTEFARLAVVHGTVSTVSDLHEIADVCGVPEVELMLATSRRTIF